MAKENKSEELNGQIFIPMESLIFDETDFQGLGKEEDKNTSGKPRNGIDEESLKNVLVERTKMMGDVEGIYQTNTDIRLAREMLVATTLSPKDLSAIEFRLKVDRSVFGEKVSTDLLEELQTYFKTNFDLESKMGEICGEALVDYGAWSYLFIPPSKVDEIIQGQDKANDIALEDINATFGDLFQKDTSFFSGEDSERLSKLNSLGIQGMSANFSVLKQNAYRRNYFGNKLEEIATESFGGNGDDQKTWNKQGLVKFKNRHKEQGLKNNPLVYKVPVDCILPIHEPSDPSDHLAYLILVDSKGRIVSRSENSDYAGDLERKLQKAMNSIVDEKSSSKKSTGDFQIIKSVDGWNQQDKIDPEEFIRLYAQSVMEPIIKELEENGLDEGGLQVDENSHIYRIMLERALSKKETRVLFVPADYVSYMAFDYNAAGQGVGLLEKTKFYASLRAILQIADMMNSVTNSIPRTEFEVTLDETDNDGLQTLEAVMHELGRMTVLNFPVGTTNPSDIITSIQKAAYSIKVNGGDKFPNTSVERSDTQRSKATSDRDLNDEVKRRLFAGLGIPVEAIDRTMEGETATGILLNDLMAAKRAMERQLIYRKGMEDIIRTYSYFSANIREVCKKHGIGQEKFEDFLWALRLQLPTADTSKLEQQQQAFDTMNRFMEEAVGHYITDDMLRGIVGDNDMSRNILDDMRQIFHSELMRQWMRQNNILPQLEQIVDLDKEENMINPLKEHYGAIFKNFGPVMRHIMKQANKIDKIADKVRDGEDEDDSEEGKDKQPVRRVGAAVPFNEEGGNAFDDDFDFDAGFGGFEGPEAPQEAPQEEPEEEPQEEEEEAPETPQEEPVEPEEPEEEEEDPEQAPE